MYDNLTRTNLEFAHREAEKRIVELEKENAGLKARLNAINLLTPELEKMSELKTQRLTKATEIIKILLKYDRGQFFDNRRIYEKYVRTRGEAEQFLKEIEK
jgi:hypothetical protein